MLDWVFATSRRTPLIFPRRVRRSCVLLLEAGSGMGPAYIDNVSGQDGVCLRGRPRINRRSIVVALAERARCVTCFFQRKGKHLEPILVVSAWTLGRMLSHFRQLLVKCVVCTPPFSFFSRTDTVILVVVIFLVGNPEAGCFVCRGRALESEIGASAYCVQFLFPRWTISVYVQEPGSGRFVAPCSV